MIKNIGSNKFHFFLWIIIFLSICLNVFLISKTSFNYNSKASEFLVNKSEDNVAATLPQQGTINEPSSQTTSSKEELINQPVSYHTISAHVKNQSSFKKTLEIQGVAQEDIKKIFDMILPLINFKSLKEGSYIQMEVPTIHNTSSNVIPRKLTFFANNNKIIVNYNDKNRSYDVKKTTLPNEWKVKYITGKVQGSFFSSIKKAGLEPVIATQLVNLFSYNIDFQRDIKSGDNFKVLYEYQTSHTGKLIKYPRILYATINFGTKNQNLYRHELSNGVAEYFDAQGNSVKKALLKTPIKNARITSGFCERTHPVYGFSHMHPALDYGAPHGAPILAAGDGIIEFVKKQNRGYGNHVKIKHNGTYSTLYAHMSRFAGHIKLGARVKQGQVIGFVGATGTATGPHLHYEVIEKGRKVNPAKVKVAQFFSLKGKDLAKFKNNINKVEQMVAELNYNKNLKIAQLERN